VNRIAWTIGSLMLGSGGICFMGFFYHVTLTFLEPSNAFSKCVGLF
jgi:hypothetical protein